MHPDHPPSPSPEVDASVAARDAAILRDQREANEKLVLATILACEDADGLRIARDAAREDADAAKEARASAEQIAGDLRDVAARDGRVAEFRERLIGIVGHDLRNPLNTILMASELLVSRGNLDESDVRLVNRVSASGERMARMIAQLLEFTRVRLGTGFWLVAGPADAGAVCANIAEEMRITASCELLTTSTGDVTGFWDADRLGNVVSNLTGNAVDHATPGTPVRIDARVEGHDVVIDVTNEGECIPPHLLPGIFDAYRRVATGAHSTADHLGLGLYISWEIARAHGGSLTVRSEGGSTTFTMRLPRVPPPADSQS